MSASSRELQNYRIPSATPEGWERPRQRLLLVDGQADCRKRVAQSEDCRAIAENMDKHAACVAKQRPEDEEKLFERGCGIKHI
jgi:hypothetical protein